MIPNLFWKKKIPRKLPEGMQAVVDRLKKSKNKEDCLKQTHAIITKRFKAVRWGPIKHPIDLFRTDLDKMWNHKTYMHCTHYNYLTRILLVRSGLFKEKEVKLKLTFIKLYSLHQYLQVNVNREINLDTWGKQFGIRLGDYAHGFNI